MNDEARMEAAKKQMRRILQATPSHLHLTILNDLVDEEHDPMKRHRDAEHDQMEAMVAEERIGDYPIRAVRQDEGEAKGLWMLMDADKRTNAGPGARCYNTRPEAVHAIQCLIATDDAVSHSDRFWALMAATGARN